VRAGLATLLLAASVLMAGCGGPEPPTEGKTPRPGPSREERERVRRFWERFETADASRRNGRWAEAIDVYAEALDADPQHERALYGRANCLLELDRHAEALPHLQRLIELNPLSQSAHVQLAYLRSSPRAACCFDLEVAQRELERATEINREETGALMRLAELQFALGQDDEATRLLEQVRQTNSHSVGAPWLLARLALARGSSAEAAALLDEALARARGPELPTAVPAEGDTRGDHRLVESTLAAKGLVPPVWKGLEGRHSDGPWSPEALATELARLDPALALIAAARAAD